ncbi:MAG: hypothetical protein ABI811_22525, partial [Acidobacteriota bacterium]
LLEDTFSANDLFVACLSTKHLKLYEYVDGTCKTVPLPAGIPENVAAAGHADTGGGPGQNRTPAGNTVGKMTGVRFGTSGSRESARGAMEHYFTLVDRGLASLIGERPLLLMGVREEIAAYRRVSHCHSLLHAEVDGNMETLTAAQIANLAKAAALDDYRRQGEETLHQFHEMRDRQRTSRDAREILVAAAEGRVHQLCVRAGTELVEPMEEGLDRAHLPGEDLINAAVAETLAKGRSVFLLPQDRMPVNESLCAILRY